MDQIPSTDDFYPLGRPTALYELTPKEELRYIALYAGLLLLSLACLWLGFSIADGSKVFWIGLGIGLLPAGIYSFYVWYTRRDLHVLVSGEGLTVLRRDDLVFYRWEDVDSIYQNLMAISAYGIRGQPSKVYTLIPKKGSPVQFTDMLPKVDALAQTIQQEIAVRRLHEDIKQMNAGESIRFGPITINNMGITSNATTLVWDQIGSVQVINGTVFIRDEANKKIRSHFPVAAIPNLLLLLLHFRQKSIVLAT
jgi:hypothetical protein